LLKVISLVYEALQATSTLSSCQSEQELHTAYKYEYCSRMNSERKALLVQ